MTSFAVPLEPQAVHHLPLRVPKPFHSCRRWLDPFQIICLQFQYSCEWVHQLSYFQTPVGSICEYQYQIPFSGFILEQSHQWNYNMSHFDLFSNKPPFHNSEISIPLHIKSWTFQCNKSLSGLDYWIIRQFWFIKIAERPIVFRWIFLDPALPICQSFFHIPSWISHTA